MSKFFHIFFRFNNHQVNINKFFRMLLDGFHHRESKRNIGYKSTIHHIHMKPIGL